ncbi:related to 37S ribosomal protein S18, mitochondrial [Saccharomycodes ludwigii]|uniref:Small ribosomal subunit protein uS11m n=1 Tax=Saccharomycodes ludwigii TaxID=36035 RepID=A0A376B789_9ASCO|nr:hypothetical protein SCDLUD_005024 [Saccharomycodes ludwigii]KAH3898701.1 hypothetical protein SCDLUD_005024 [Saccharomycodes ludwigii]SSD60528.1 related to 37S ribosomal protein S18, mitochondrial [Saccharomycodes ludwigii]
MLRNFIFTRSLHTSLPRLVEPVFANVAKPTTPAPTQPISQNTANTSSKKNLAHGKKHEVVVKYVLNGYFTKNNTHFTYSAVAEDLNFLQNNANLSYNEKYLYYLKLPHKVQFNISTGHLGFRKAARGEYEAGFQTATKVFQMIRGKNLFNSNIEIVLRDFGKGRQAFMAALNGKEGDFIRNYITRISDNTRLKIGGVRPPRTRRL